jgi:hypothetical protein
MKERIKNRVPDASKRCCVCSISGSRLGRKNPARGQISAQVQFVRAFQKVKFEGMGLHSTSERAAVQMSLRFPGVRLAIFHFRARQQEIGFGPGPVWRQVTSLLSDRSFARCLAADGGFETQGNLAERGIF